MLWCGVEKKILPCPTLAIRIPKGPKRVPDQVRWTNEPCLNGVPLSDEGHSGAERSGYSIPAGEREIRGTTVEREPEAIDLPSLP